MTRIVILVVSVFIVTSCSSRAVYEQPNPQSPANAININTATADELEKLPGIGEKTAEAIVAFRTEHGAFRRLEHIMLVPRISERRFAELQPFIRIQ